MSGIPIAASSNIASPPSVDFAWFYDYTIDMGTGKRTPEQINRDRKRVAELVLQNYTQREIIDLLEEETGLRLSQQQISYDMKKVRDDWLSTQRGSYDALVNRELARIDALESYLWQTLRDTSGPRTRAVIEKAFREAKENPEEYEVIIKKLTEYEEFHKPDPKYLDEIMECQKERRRLLGLYAPKIKKEERTLTVKAYAVVSPGDWPGDEGDVIEGEAIAAPVLPGGNNGISS